MKRLPTLVVALLMIVAMLALAACAPVSPSAAPAATGSDQAAAGPTTITWAFWGQPEEKATNERLAQAFMAEHPEIKVELWHQPWDD